MKIVLIGIAVLLVAATVIVEILRLTRPDRDWTELRLRVRTWYWMAALIAGAVLLDRTVQIAFFSLLSALALREYLTAMRLDAPRWIYALVPLQYLWIHLDWYGMFIVFIPVYAFLFQPTMLAVSGRTDGFLNRVASLHWGLMTTVFALSHAAFLNSPGLVLYLVLLTELNDVSQYVCGKLVGRHRILPTVSPRKTTEGFLGGVGVTTALSLVLAPLLTPFTPFHALLCGFVLSIAGFLGDIHVSALKRDHGIKDCSSALPGHGGILDRIDSLTFTAPLLLHGVRYFYG